MKHGELDGNDVDDWLQAEMLETVLAEGVPSK
jgi:hypothetical protein